MKRPIAIVAALLLSALLLASSGPRAATEAELALAREQGYNAALELLLRGEPLGATAP